MALRIFSNFMMTQIFNSIFQTTAGKSIYLGTTFPEGNLPNYLKYAYSLIKRSDKYI